MLVGDYCSTVMGSEVDLGDGYTAERLSSFGRGCIERMDFIVYGYVGEVKKSISVGIYVKDKQPTYDMTADLKAEWDKVYA